MTANFTYQLLFVLALASLLGGLIGATLMHIKALHYKTKQARHHKASTEKLRDQVAELEHRTAAMQRAGSAEAQLLTIAKNREDQATAQQDALQVHSRLQAQRIASLEASLLAAEERGLRLQRDFESFKTHKKQELEMSRRSRSVESPATAQTDNDLPVLNKRVNDLQLDISEVDSAQSMLELELDIAALSEDELSGSVNDIDFDATLQKHLEEEADSVG